MNLLQVYITLKHHKLVSNHIAFSIDYLNKGSRYYDHLICSRKQPAVASLLALYMRVNAIATALATSSGSNSHAAELNDLASAIWMELERRSCALLPANRKRPAPARVTQGAIPASAPAHAPAALPPCTSSVGFD